jgi:NADH-quinone oxidoreductase subunit L
LGGCGLASFALIGFWYQDKKKDFVGTPGHYAGGIQLWATPTHAGIKALLMTKAGDVMMLAGMFLIFSYAGTFGFTELLHDQSWATEMAKEQSPCSSCCPDLWWGHREISSISPERMAS